MITMNAVLHRSAYCLLRASEPLFSTVKKVEDISKYNLVDHGFFTVKQTEIIDISTTHLRRHYNRAS